MTTFIKLALLAIAAFQPQTGQKSIPASVIKPLQGAHEVPAFNPVPVGSEAPDFEATTPSGKKVKLSDFRGKVVLLDFWATWCGPCQASMPGLESIYQQIKNKGVIVLSLNTWDEKPAFLDWVKQNSGTKYHFKFVRDLAEGDHAAIRKNSVAKRLYNVIGIPTLYVIDKTGKIKGSTLGSGSEGDLVKILASLGLKAKAPEGEK